MPYRVAPAPPPKIPDGPDHIGAAQRIARRNRRIGIALTALLAAGVGASMMVHRGNRARHREAFEAARLELEACLLGPEPLAGGGPGSCATRIRHRQLTVMTTPVERRIDEALHAWPMRCAEATRTMSREAVELEDLDLQREAAHGTKQLSTMKALTAPLELALCTDAAGRARPPHLARLAPDSLPALAKPLDLEALVAHGAPAHPAKRATELYEDERLARLMPEGHGEVGTVGTTSAESPPKLPEGESMLTDRDWPGVIHVASCHAGKCQKRIVSRETFDLNDPELRASEPARFRPARAGASIVAVWRAGTLGGLRMRVAPIDRLAATPDVVVFDDLVREGAVQGTSTLDSFRVYGGTREARIFLVTGQGTWVVTIDDKGTFALR